MKPKGVPLGQVFIIAAPSGTGKSTLLSRLVADTPGLSFSVSHTTRPPRTGEQDGRDYVFTDPTSFKQLVTQGAFLEYAEVHGNYYGTLGQPVDAAIHAGRSIVLDVDVVGAAAVRAKIPSACSIFIMPPSLEALRRRLTHRGKDSEVVIQRRLVNARGEMERALEFDFLLLNEDLEQCYRDLQAIVANDRLRTSRRKTLWTDVLESFSLES